MTNVTEDERIVPICYAINTNPSIISEMGKSFFALTKEGEQEKFNVVVNIIKYDDMYFGSYTIETVDGVPFAAEAGVLESGNKSSITDFTKIPFNLLNTKDFSFLWFDGEEMTLANFRKVVQEWKSNNSQTNS